MRREAHSSHKKFFNKSSYINKLQLDDIRNRILLEYKHIYTNKQRRLVHRLQSCLKDDSLGDSVKESEEGGEVPSAMKSMLRVNSKPPSYYADMMVGKNPSSFSSINDQNNGSNSFSFAIAAPQLSLSQRLVHTSEQLHRDMKEKMNNIVDSQLPEIKARVATTEDEVNKLIQRQAEDNSLLDVELGGAWKSGFEIQSQEQSLPSLLKQHLKRQRQLSQMNKDKDKATIKVASEANQVIHRLKSLSGERKRCSPLLKLKLDDQPISEEASVLQQYNQVISRQKLVLIPCQDSNLSGVPTKRSINTIALSRLNIKKPVNQYEDCLQRVGSSYQTSKLNTSSSLSKDLQYSKKSEQTYDLALKEYSVKKMVFEQFVSVKEVKIISAANGKVTEEVDQEKFVDTERNRSKSRSQLNKPRSRIKMILAKIGAEQSAPDQSKRGYYQEGMFLKVEGPKNNEVDSSESNPGSNKAAYLAFDTTKLQLEKLSAQMATAAAQLQSKIICTEMDQPLQIQGKIFQSCRLEDNEKARDKIRIMLEENNCQEKEQKVLQGVIKNESEIKTLKQMRQEVRKNKSQSYGIKFTSNPQWKVDAVSESLISSARVQSRLSESSLLRVNQAKDYNAAEVARSIIQSRVKQQRRSIFEKDPCGTDVTNDVSRTHSYSLVGAEENTPSFQKYENDLKSRAPSASSHRKIFLQNDKSNMTNSQSTIDRFANISFSHIQHKQQQQQEEKREERSPLKQLNLNSKAKTLPQSSERNPDFLERSQGMINMIYSQTPQIVIIQPESPSNRLVLHKNFIY